MENNEVNDAEYESGLLVSSTAGLKLQSRSRKTKSKAHQHGKAKTETNEDVALGPLLLPPPRLRMVFSSMTRDGTVLPEKIAREKVSTVQIHWVQIT